MSYTKGPWITKQFDDCQLVIWAEDAKTATVALIAIVSMHDDLHYSTPEQRDEARANACLIVAAPELAEALSELYAMVKGECPSLLDEDRGGTARLDLAIEAALKKAGLL